MPNNTQDGYDVRNYTYIAMIKRYGKTSKTIKDKRKKCKNKNFWKKDWLED